MFTFVYLQRMYNIIYFVMFPMTLDVEVFSDEVIQCSQMAQSNLLFLNMQNVLQRWYRRLGAQHSLERLAEEFMNFEVNGDLSSHSSAG